MKERSDQWQMQITELTWSVEQALKNVPIDKFNWAPEPGVWSIGEIVDHLILVNQSYFPTFEKITSRNHKMPWLGYLPGLSKKTGEMILDAMDKPQKTKTFQNWQPKTNLVDPNITRKFVDTQHALSAFVEKLDPFMETNIVISSPVNRWIVYPLDLSIPIILAHEQRHLNQIRERIAQYQQGI